MNQEKISNLLKTRWAKSDGISIRDHTDILLKNLNKLKSLFGLEIEKNLSEEEKNKFWKALELACEHHDYGKIHPHFQQKIKNPEFQNKKFKNIRHNILSLVFLPPNLEEDIKQLVAFAIVNHHDYEPEENILEKLKEALNDLKDINIDFNNIYKKPLLYEEDDFFKESKFKLYYLVKGFLLRLDHSSSSKIQEVETGKIKDNYQKVSKYLQEYKKSDLNNMQKFVYENKDENLLIIASTGMGKTEAGFIFLENKGFFTIPIRTSSNAIYDRAENIFGKDNVGLLHSTAGMYLLDSIKEDERNFYKEKFLEDIILTKNFSKPLTVATPDQLFPFVFRFKGFEKYYSLFSYSKFVIDEIQLFEPYTLGFLVKAIEKAQDIGGKFMIMTATVPEFLKEDFNRLNFKESKFIYEKLKHNIKIIKNSLLSSEGIDLIKKLSEEAKVLVVVNTKKRAIELARKLNIKNILHSNYIWKIRKEKEKDIKQFFDNKEKGLYITTQIAEVSLDLDADFLVTELSTADSLFQRMGRVNRKGEKDYSKANVFIFTEESSGIGTIYRKELNDITKKNLKDGIITEEEKINIIQSVYKELKEKDKKFFEDYKSAKDYIDSLWYIKEQFNKEKATEIFRDIDSITVIPSKYKEEVEKLIIQFKETKDSFEKLQTYYKILDYTFDIPKYLVKNYNPINGLKGIYWFNVDYNEEFGSFEMKEEENIF